jgi:hypothetical protein
LKTTADEKDYELLPYDATAWHQLAIRAKKLGFFSEIILRLCNTDPDRERAIKALYNARPPRYFNYGPDFEILVTALMNASKTAKPIRTTEALAQLTSHMGEPVARRCGRVYSDNYDKDRECINISNMISKIQKNTDITSLFVRRSVFHAFWGWEEGQETGQSNGQEDYQRGGQDHEEDQEMDGHRNGQGVGQSGNQDHESDQDMDDPESEDDTETDYDMAESDHDAGIDGYAAESTGMRNTGTSKETQRKRPRGNGEERGIKSRKKQDRQATARRKKKRTQKKAQKPLTNVNGQEIPSQQAAQQVRVVSPAVLQEQQRPPPQLNLSAQEAPPQQTQQQTQPGLSAISQEQQPDLTQTQTLTVENTGQEEQEEHTNSAQVTFIPGAAPTNLQNSIVTIHVRRLGGELVFEEPRLRQEFKTRIPAIRAEFPGRELHLFLPDCRGIALDDLDTLEFEDVYFDEVEL